MDIELAQALAENELLKSLLYCTKRSCNNCGKVNCENFQRQRKDCCENWVLYKDYIKELEAQIEKMKKIIFDLLWFEDNLDPYMYDCNDAQEGNLLKPFDNAKDILKDCICKKCKGTGEVRVGYNGWTTNPCPSCEGRGYIIKEIKEKRQKKK